MQPDSSDHAERISPELAALDAAMQATADMDEWGTATTRARAGILSAGIEAAAPAIEAAERERISRILAEHGRHNRPCAACRRHGRPWVPLVNLINVIRDGF